MRVPIFQIDAFTTRRFAGNPAAVMPMDHFPEDAVLQAVAAENNLAETAFIVREGGDYLLRWFTPTTEVPLCGHATLASAAVVMERLEPKRSKVLFPLGERPQRETDVRQYRIHGPGQPLRHCAPDEDHVPHRSRHARCCHQAQGVSDRHHERPSISRIRVHRCCRAHDRKCTAVLGRSGSRVQPFAPRGRQMRAPPNPSLHPTRYSGLRPLPRVGELKR